MTAPLLSPKSLAVYEIEANFWIIVEVYLQGVSSSESGTTLKSWFPASFVRIRLPRLIPS